MLLVTFNVNGIRARLHQLDFLVEKYDPDIICLQEIKVSDEDFPHSSLEHLGYKIFNYGQKGFHGVATLSKLEPLKIVKGLDGGEDELQKRFIQCDFSTNAGTISVCNSYFPQGENRKHEQKFPYKERYMKRIQSYLREIDNKIVLTGDFNIAPNANDRAIGEDNEKRWLREGHTAFLPEELEWFSEFEKLNLYDTWRTKNPDKNISTWFDYRSRGFEREPKRGLRIDYFLMSKELEDFYIDSNIDHEIRGMEKPSDHCPVTLKLNI